MKRLAAKASLQKPYEDQIMTPFQLYQWSSSNITGISFHYCSLEEYEAEKNSLEERFNNCQTIPGTRRLHYFLPQSQDTVLTKRYSACSTSKIQRVMKSPTDLEVDGVTGHVTCIHKSQWWVAQVLENDSENGEMKLSLLSPNGPSRWYNYPLTQNILQVPITDILTIVKPRTTTGRSYFISQDESKAATQKLKNFRP